MHAIANAVVPPSAFRLGAGLRVDTAAIEQASAHGALDVVREEGHAEADAQRIHIGVGVEHGAVRFMQAVYSRVVGGRVPQLLEAAEPWPVGRGAQGVV